VQLECAVPQAARRPGIELPAADLPVEPAARLEEALVAQRAKLTSPKASISADEIIAVRM
jgi:hypothetical protein